VFEHRVLRRIFGPKRDEATLEWRSCTMSGFIFCTHPQISLGEEGKVYSVLVGEPEGKSPLGRSRRR
jgi:hypothetical protein